MARRLHRAGAISLCLAAWGLAYGCGARTGVEVPDLGPDVGLLPVACTPGVVELRPAAATVMLVLDRSRSMTSTLGSAGHSRWHVLTESLAATLPSVDDTMRIGALAFPSAGGGTASCSVGGDVLLPATGQVDALIAALRATGPGGATPTAAAIDAAAAQLLGVRAASSARALILATDGAPDCNSALDPSTCACVGGARCMSATRCLDDVRTSARLARHAADGLPTYVVGIADDSDAMLTSVLDAMARAGGRPTTGAHAYYAARSASELERALAAIRDQVALCTYLSSSVPDMAGTMRIALDGVEVPYDETGGTGWRWVDRDNGELVLQGSACDATGELAVLEATVTCGEMDGG